MVEIAVDVSGFQKALARLAAEWTIDFSQANKAMEAVSQQVQNSFGIALDKFSNSHYNDNCQLIETQNNWRNTMASGNGQAVLEKAKSQAEGLDIQYLQVQFPIVHIGSNEFSFTNLDGSLTDLFSMSGPGHTYVLHSLGVYDQRLEFPSWKKDPANWAAVVNSVASQVDPFGEYVAIVVSGRLMGLPKNYNIVDHLTVLETLEMAHMTHRLQTAIVKPYEMALYLRLNDREEDVSWGVRVANGMTGHVTLNFQGYVKIGDWEYGLIESSVVKHLGNVPQWHEDFNGFANEVMAVEVDVALANCPEDVAMTAINQAYREMDEESQDKIADIVSKARWGGFDNAEAMLIWLSQFVTYGQKPQVRALMNAVTEKAFTYTNGYR